MTELNSERSFNLADFRQHVAGLICVYWYLPIHDLLTYVVLALDTICHAIATQTCFEAASECNVAPTR